MKRIIIITAFVILVLIPFIGYFRPDGFEIRLKAGQPFENNEVKQEIKAVLTDRMKYFNAKFLRVDFIDDRTIALKGVVDKNTIFRVREIIAEQGGFSIYPVNTKIRPHDMLPKWHYLMKDEYGKPRAVNMNAGLKNLAVIETRVNTDEIEFRSDESLDEYSVILTFSPKSRAEFEAFTKKNLRKMAAMMVGDEIYSTRMIEKVMKDEVPLYAGNSKDKALNISILLKMQPLPVKLKIEP